MSNYEEQLKPCPWCGKKVEWESADHFIVITCKTCRYHRNFSPLVGYEMTDVYVGNGMYYNCNAQEEAVDSWNTRLGESNEKEVAEKTTR